MILRSLFVVNSRFYVNKNIYKQVITDHVRIPFRLTVINTQKFTLLQYNQNADAVT